MPSRLPALAAASSFATSPIIFSAAALNLALSFQISALARLGMPLSVPSPKAPKGRRATVSTMAALSAATLASKGVRPCAMAPMRAMWLPMIVNAPWRYLMASSAFWNCADAGSATRQATEASRARDVFITGLRCAAGKGSVKPPGRTA